MSIYDILAILIEQVASVSWQKLGLQHDAITGKLETNYAEAKVAIDVTARLVQHLESQLDEEDRRRLNSMLRDLRVNYVQKAGH